MQPKPKLPKAEEPAQGTSADSESQDRANEERAEQDEQKLARAVPEDAAPLEVQTGIASWYGPPYHNRRGSNGEIYNMNDMTAAHLTLPWVYCPRHRSENWQHGAGAHHRPWPFR